MESDSDDDSFVEDMEALKRACYLVRTDAAADSIQPPSGDGVVSAVNAAEKVEEDESNGEEDHDTQLLQSIQDRFFFSVGLMEPLRRRRMASSTLDSDYSDSDDDYETLRAIHRRFAAYDDGGLKNITSDVLQGPEQVGAPILDSIKETSNSSVERSNAREGFVNCVDICKPISQKEAYDGANGSQSSDLVERDRHADDLALIPSEHSHFPDSALTFFDAIKKNRSYQKLIRGKMIQMESRIEELRKLTERVKVLKDFQLACKKRTGRALSQKKDDRIQLISKRKAMENLKADDKKLSVMCKGPPENPHVANYRQALMAFGIPLCRKSWSEKERENLVKGVKQQFQELLLCRSVDLISEEDGSANPTDLDSVLLSIKHVEITPERIRSFLPKVKWEQLAAMYLPGRTGDECQTRFLNFEDPLINHGPWNSEEDKNLLHIIQQRGLSNWIEIAASLGTSRTPFQCLARYQRSLNASIIKSEWTKEEDRQLREAVKKFGTSDWQLVASVIEGRTGTQCSTRWLKTLHPAKERQGRWSEEEKKRLEVAVMLFGPQAWNKIASCVPGRTGVQCRERWSNCSNPSLTVAPWSDEEDRKLEAAISKHGYCWAKVALCIPPRTRSQCLRRWKVLYPDDARRRQEARKMQKVALISNFVDREKEKPNLRPTDFIMPVTLAIGSSCSEPSQQKKRKSRSKKANNDAEKGHLSRENGCNEVPMLTDRIEIENSASATEPPARSGKRTASKKQKVDPSCTHLQPGPNMSVLEMPNAERMNSFAGESNGTPSRNRSECAGESRGLPSRRSSESANTNPLCDARERIIESNTCASEAIAQQEPEREDDGEVRPSSCANTSLLNYQIVEQSTTGAKAQGKFITVDRETCSGGATTPSADLDCSTPTSAPTDISIKDGDDRGRSLSSKLSLAPYHPSEESTLTVSNDSAAFAGWQSDSGTLPQLQNGETHPPRRKVGSKTKKKSGIRPHPGSSSCDHHKKAQQTEDEVGDDTLLSEFYSRIKRK